MVQVVPQALEVLTESRNIRLLKIHAFSMVCIVSLPALAAKLRIF